MKASTATIGISLYHFSRKQKARVLVDLRRLEREESWTISKVKQAKLKSPLSVSYIIVSGVGTQSSNLVSDIPRIQKAEARMGSKH